ncbi:MAG TPA: hypothetical protein VF123_04600 [Candidatus Sulfotelmatobacter sp.]
MFPPFKWELRGWTSIDPSPEKPGASGRQGLVAGVFGMAHTLDHDSLKDLADQMMSGSVVSIGEKRIKVERTGSRRLRTVRFEIGGREYQMIEQNPEKPSRWGKLAREGHRVVQVRDAELGKYVAAVVDGKVREYGRLRRRDSAE